MGCGQSAIRHPNSKQKVTVDGAEHKTSKTKTEQKERTITNTMLTTTSESNPTDAQKSSAPSKTKTDESKQRKEADLDVGEYENTDNISNRMRDVTVKQVDGKWIYFNSDGTIFKVETDNHNPSTEAKHEQPHKTVGTNA